MNEKRYILKYLDYETSNGEIIQGDPYFIDKKQVFVDADEFSIDGYLTMSEEQVLYLLNENEQLKKELDSFKPVIFDDCYGKILQLYEKIDDGDV